MPFFLSNSRLVATSARDSLRWTAPASTAASARTFRSAPDNVSHLLAKQHRLRVVLVIGDGDKLLDFPELVGRNDADGVLLAIGAFCSSPRRPRQTALAWGLAPVPLPTPR